MALQSITNINVDFCDKKYILINAKQLDKQSRFLSVTCYNHGEIYPINAGEHSAYIRYKKSDEHSVFNFCDINRKGEILVELTEQMLASEGIGCADLVIVNKGKANVDADTGEIVAIDNASVLSTMTFFIDVSETAVENAEIESTYEFNLLNSNLEKYWADFEDIMKTSKSWAVGNTGIRENEKTDNSKYYSQLSRSYAIGDAGGIRENEDEDNAKYYSGLSSESANDANISKTNAAESANSASDSADIAVSSATKASNSASAAYESALLASESENAAKEYATLSESNMNSASNSATNATTSASEAYDYYLRTEAIVNGLNGAFLPKGTITFAELIELKESGAVAAGYLYHISDDFTTDENFRVPEIECSAGTSVYYTVDGQFDCFVGTTVAGVKGESETKYRTGMVNITPENVGAISSADIATVDEIKTYLGI